MAAPHVSVLKNEVLDYLNLHPNDKVIDCTVGAGGHAAAVLEKIAPNGELLGLDLDSTALTIASQRLNRFEGRFRLKRGNFDRISEFAKAESFAPVAGILADLGVSSMQLDTPNRGFSFNKDAPLDMRMGEDAPYSAEEIVNRWPEHDLADIIYRYGEERKSRRIAKAIVVARPIHRTLELAEIVSKAVGGRRGKKTHPATKTFQAIRIAANDELGAIERFLPQALSLLAPGGRLAIISFHSLEDRIVKQFFKQESQDCICPPRQPVCTCNHHASISRVSRKPVVATNEEQSQNPRARSAKLRVAERLRNE